MPFDSQGNYSLPAGYLATDGETILASQHNPPLEDIAAGMNGLLLRSGVAAMTGQFKGFAGTEATPGIAFNGSSSLGFYKTTNGWGWSYNGAKVIEFGAGGIILGATPIGSGMDYWGTTAPAGWLFPYGQAVSRTTYAALFAVLGTTYGAGNGSTTFNLPDKRDRASFGKGDMGGTAANRLQVTTTISTTDNSTSATVASATGLAVGMFINSANVPSGTTIASFSGTAITMSAEATDTASGTAVVFSGLSSSALGGVGGAATGSLGIWHLPAHDHGGQTGPISLTTFLGNTALPVAGNTRIQVSGASSGDQYQTPATYSFSVTPNATISSQGGGQAFNKLPPGIICNYIIFAGA